MQLPPINIDADRYRTGDKFTPYQPPPKEKFYNEICILGVDDDVGRAAKILNRAFGIYEFKHIIQYEKYNILQFMTAKKLDGGGWAIILNTLKRSNIQLRQLTKKDVQAKINLRNSTANP